LPRGAPNATPLEFFSTLLIRRLRSRRRWLPAFGRSRKFDRANLPTGVQ